MQRNERGVKMLSKSRSLLVTMTKPQYVVLLEQESSERNTTKSYSRRDLLAWRVKLRVWSVKIQK